MAKQALNPSSKTDARINDKIAGANDALRPILLHLRAVVHEAAPDATETIKWGMPFFELNGAILANMGIFKQHCSFGFWSRSMTEHLQADGVHHQTGAGSLGKIQTMEDLPAREQLLSYISTAANHIRDGVAESPMAPRKPRRGPDGAASAKPAIAVPPALAQALAASPKARQTFDAFPPSCRREYLAWITEAKRDETRARRIQQAVAQMEEGKRHNWQYDAKR